MSTTVIHQVLAESQAGKLIFAEVVRRLLEVGVESYFSDLADGREVFYMSDHDSSPGTHLWRLLAICGCRGDSRSPDGHHPLSRVHQAFGGCGCNRLLGISHRQEGHLLWP